MKILVVVEATATGFSSYSPDLPGCVATGPSREVVEGQMREAIELHLEGLRADGTVPPEANSYATVIEVVAYHKCIRRARLSCAFSASDAGNPASAALL